MESLRKLAKCSATGCSLDSYRKIKIAISEFCEVDA